MFERNWPCVLRPACNSFGWIKFLSRCHFPFCAWLIFHTVNFYCWLDSPFIYLKNRFLIALEERVRFLKTLSGFWCCNNTLASLGRKSLRSPHWISLLLGSSFLWPRYFSAYLGFVVIGKVWLQKTFILKGPILYFIFGSCLLFGNQVLPLGMSLGEQGCSISWGGKFLSGWVLCYHLLGEFKEDNDQICERDEFPWSLGAHIVAWALIPMVGHIYSLRGRAIIFVDDS